MSKKDITFEPLALYLQEKNGVFKRVGLAIIDMAYIMIFDQNIDNHL